MRETLVTAAALTWLGTACGSSTPANESPEAAPAATPAAPAEALVPFTVIENGRPVISPAADGSFTVDGPARYVIGIDGTLTRDGSTLIRRIGDSIQTDDGTELAEVTDIGLRFGTQGELTVGADGTVSLGAAQTGRETFQVQGMNGRNRRAVFTVLTWLMVGEAANQTASAAATGAATEADCRKVIDHAAKLGMLQSPDGKKEPPPPEARDALAKQCVQAGMTVDAVACFMAATNAQQWADCDKKF